MVRCRLVYLPGTLSFDTLYGGCCAHKSVDGIATEQLATAPDSLIHPLTGFE